MNDEAHHLHTINPGIKIPVLRRTAAGASPVATAEGNMTHVCCEEGSWGRIGMGLSELALRRTLFRHML